MGVRRTSSERQERFPVAATYRKTDRLKPHPLNEKVYGDGPDAELIASVKAKGILNPIVVDSQGRILSGHRRWSAAKEARLDTVPTLRYYQQERYYPDTAATNPHYESTDGIRASELTAAEVHELAIEEFIIESNRQREKTAGQKARETAELFRIEKEMAAVRRASTLVQNVPHTVPPSQGVSGETREIVAQKTGQSKNTVEKQVTIVTRAENGDETAQRALKELDANKISYSAAYRMVTEPAAKHSVEEKEPTDQSHVTRQVNYVERSLNGIDIGIRNAVEDVIMARYCPDRKRLATLLRNKAEGFLLYADALEERRIRW